MDLFAAAFKVVKRINIYCGKYPTLRLFKATDVLSAFVGNRPENEMWVDTNITYCGNNGCKHENV